MPHSPDGHEQQPSPLRDVDLAADRFEQELRQGHRPQITEYLAEVPDELRLQLLVELVCLDLEYTTRDHHVTLNDYFRTFPALGALSPGERADLETHARRCDDRRRSIDHVAPTMKSSAEVPRSIGRFTIAGRLGSGTQADVYLSFHPELFIPVVIKWHRVPDAGVERPGAHNPGGTNPGRPVGDDPNLVRVYDLGFHEDRPYLVLEHVQGQTLDQWAEGRVTTPREAAELVAALAEAAHSAHEQGVIHQDINPRNVLIDGRGQPRLIDFGLAWFRSPWVDAGTEVRPDAGTPRYLSLEQADPKIGPVGPRTDVFGLGAVLYFLLSGKPLYDGATLHEVLRQAARGSYDVKVLTKRGIPNRLALACRTALAVDPQARFATAADLAAAAQGGGSPAAPPRDSRVRSHVPRRERRGMDAGTAQSPDRGPVARPGDQGLAAGDPLRPVERGPPRADR